jgi:hypothetical protein
VKSENNLLFLGRCPSFSPFFRLVCAAVLTAFLQKIIVLLACHPLSSHSELLFMPSLHHSPHFLLLHHTAAWQQRVMFAPDASSKSAAAEIGREELRED